MREVRHSSICLYLGMLAILASVSGASAQQPYPAKPVRVIVPYPAGGVVELFARAVTDEISRRWSQPFIIEPHPGASASIGTLAALNHEPDGHTWLIGGASLIANPLLFKSARWDPVRDFAGVGVAGSTPMVFVVTDKLPAKSLGDAIDLAKAAPGRLAAATMFGSSSHFNLEMLKQAASVQFLTVPYKGAPPIVADLVNGSVQVSMLPLAVALPHAQSGRIRALAVAAWTRSPLYPNVPTFAEAGFAQAAFVSTYIFVVPRATPAAVVARINAGINEALKSPATRTRVLALGSEVAMPMSPAEIDAMIKSDYDRYAALIRRAGIRIED